MISFISIITCIVYENCEKFWIRYENFHFYFPIWIFLLFLFRSIQLFAVKSFYYLQNELFGLMFEFL